jgi:hypothetical protein
MVFEFEPILFAPRAAFVAKQFESGKPNKSQLPLRQQET